MLCSKKCAKHLTNKPMNPTPNQQGKQSAPLTLTQKSCRNQKCPKKNPQPISNFYITRSHGRKPYRRWICKYCYNRLDSSSSRRDIRHTRREVLRLARTAIATQECGFVPRYLRKSPDDVPDGQKWCWFCEELHELDWFIGKVCREYATFQINTWRRDPTNRRLQRYYDRRYRFKTRMKIMIERSGCRVYSIRYIKDVLEIVIVPKYMKKWPLHKLS